VEAKRRTKPTAAQAPILDLDMSTFPPDKIRNFCITAHIGTLTQLPLIDIIFGYSSLEARGLP